MKYLSLITALLLAGCDYIPRESFTLTTVEGKQLRLTCPVVSPQRSKLTYTIEGQCVVEKLP